jgi:hypothetical protein
MLLTSGFSYAPARCTMAGGGPWRSRAGDGYEAPPRACFHCLIPSPGIKIALPDLADLRVQAMAGFGDGADDGSNAVALGADTSQQTLLTIPHA